MLAFMRVGFVAFILAITAFTASAADKPFQRIDLDDAAIKLEAQIKADTRPAAQPAEALKRAADVAFERGDFPVGLQMLSQIATLSPQDSANWLRLARAVLQIRPANNSERVQLLERAATAAYIAYQRAHDKDEEASALVTLSRTFSDRKLWRPALDTLRLSLELREVAQVRQDYEQLRNDHGFRILDYSVDSDAASPRACIQFSENLAGKRTDFSPFVAVAGQDKPAVTVQDKQLCIEGLKHGERYNIVVRTGLPSAVNETLQKSAEYNIYVRDRKPFVHFTSRSYVLPKVGQRGIPIVSVNTKTVAVHVFRVGDRNLIDTVLSEDFQRTLYSYDLERLRSERGQEVWKGDLKVDSPLNQEVTTAFPVDEALPNMAPGVYVMAVEPGGPEAGKDANNLATQWFIVSDLGLSAFSGTGGITAFVNSLATTQAKVGIEVRLMARNNEVLATRTTDANGMVYFEAGLVRGQGGLAPAMLVASTNPSGDYAFLNLKAPAFDLTDRGVAGRPTPAGLDAFVYTERGVYRSGETVYVTALLRDPKGVAAVGAPLTLVIERPDGVEYRRVTVPDQGVGGHTLALPIVASASTGTWRVRAYTDPKQPAIGETTFMVEDYVPDRIEFDLASPTGKISKAEPAQITVDGRYLYGAPASALNLEGELVVQPAGERPGFPGYVFGNSEEQVVAQRKPIDNLPQTDPQGKATFPVALDKVPATSKPLEAQVIVRMAEPGGRAVERKITLPVTPTDTLIGVKPLFTGSALAEGDIATFDVVLVAPDGKARARKGVRYELVKVDTRYQWYRQDGRWQYEPIKTTSRIADGTLDLAADKPGRISAPVKWGRYRLEVSTDNPSDPITVVSFDAGFYAEAKTDTPDLLEIALDKSEYKPGETVNVAVTARTAGKVTLNVVGDGLLSTKIVEVQAGTAKIPLTVGEDWGNGAYVVATLLRPLDEKASRMPGRAIGVQWLSVDRKARTLGVALTLPNVMRPNSALTIPVKIDGLTPGEDARIVVAAVDVGILNLTNYKPPRPDDYYLGQRRLSAEIRDLYGQLIDGMQGTRGQIRTGGDVNPNEIQGSPPSQKPLALYSGIVTVGPDGTAEVKFDIPAFSGSIRVMAVAWSKTKVGQAHGDVIVRDPVVVTATLPRFLLMGDRGTVHLELDNVEGPAGDYALAVSTDGPLSVANPEQKLTLNAKQRQGLALPVNATGVGTGTVALRVSGPNGFTLERSYTLNVKPATQVLARRTVRTLAKNESLTLSADMFADLVPGTGAVSVSIGPSSALDVASLLQALDRYPFGCSEQIVSRAMPLLYVNELAAETHLALDKDIDERIRDAIIRVVARQGSNGSFGLWSQGGDDPWLDAYVTDFLTRARERGFAVPDVAFKLALDRLRNYVANAPEPNKDGGLNLAYALYVLARNGAAPIGDLRYIADTKLADIRTPIAKAQLAAALGMTGDKTRADRVFAQSLDALPAQPKLEVSRIDYGSNLRDAAALVTLAAEGEATRATVIDAVARVEAARGLTPYTSTQENAWMVLAARALMKEGIRVSLDVNGTTQNKPLYRTIKASEVAAPFKVVNTGETDLQAVLSVSGAPVTPEPAAEKGFKIERQYFTLEGKPADATHAKQNDRFVVVLKITEPDPQYGRVIVADYLPAGFEIDNPRLVSSGDTGTLSWIQDAKQPEHTEFRDDRFTAAFLRNSNDAAVFTIAYVVRAVSPGHYVLPQAYVEDMYRPDRFGRTGTGTIDVAPAR